MTSSPCFQGTRSSVVKMKMPGSRDVLTHISRRCRSKSQQFLTLMNRFARRQLSGSQLLIRYVNALPQLHTVLSHILQPIQVFEHASFQKMIQLAAHAPPSKGVKIPDRRQTRQAIIKMFKQQLVALRNRLNVRDADKSFCLLTYSSSVERLNPGPDKPHLSPARDTTLQQAQGECL